MSGKTCCNLVCAYNRATMMAPCEHYATCADYKAQTSSTQARILYGLRCLADETGETGVCEECEYDHFDMGCAHHVASDALHLIMQPMRWGLN